MSAGMRTRSRIGIITLRSMMASDSSSSSVARRLALALSLKTPRCCPAAGLLMATAAEATDSRRRTVVYIATLPVEERCFGAPDSLPRALQPLGDSPHGGEQGGEQLVVRPPRRAPPLE